MNNSASKGVAGTDELGGTVVARPGQAQEPSVPMVMETLAGSLRQAPRRLRADAIVTGRRAVSGELLLREWFS